MSGLHLGQVMDEVASVLAQIPGLRVFAFPPPTLTPPAGYVSYPASVDYLETYQRGVAGFTELPITLLAGKPTEISSRNTIAEWVAADGPVSVVALMDTHEWVSCDGVTISDTVEFDIEKIGGVEYLAVVFRASVTGPGKDAV